MKRLYLLVEVECKKDVPDLTDKVAGRVYCLDGVENATAVILDRPTSYQMAQAQKEESHG